MIVHWRLDELTGTSAADASGKGNAGTLSPDGPVWTDGVIGGALDFNGAGDLLSAPSSTPINGLKGQMTAALWIYKRANLPNYGSMDGDTELNGTTCGSCSTTTAPGTSIRSV